jgi:hypothetical protein
MLGSLFRPVVPGCFQRVSRPTRASGKLQSLFRAVNERIEETAESCGVTDDEAI